MKLFVAIAVFLICGIPVYAENKSFQQTVDSIEAIINSSDINIQEEAENRLTVADMYYENEMYAKALKHYIQSLKYYRSIEKPEKQGTILIQIGSIYSYISEYEKALDYYLKALKHSEKNEDLVLKRNAHYNIGVFYSRVGNFTLSGKYLKKALSIGTSNDKELQIYSILGTVCANLNLADSALIFFEKAQSLANEENNMFEKGVILNNIGALFHKNKRIDEAEKYYTEALSILKSAGNIRGQGISLTNLALISLNEGSEDKGIDLLKKAILLYDGIMDRGNMMKCYQILSEVYNSRKDFRASHEYLMKYSSLRDSVMNEEIMAKISMTQNQYEISNIEAELQLLEKEKEMEKQAYMHEVKLLEKDNEIKQIRLYLATGIGILLIIIAFLVIRTQRTRIYNNRLKQEMLNKEKLQLKTELEHKNKEIETFALHIIEKNDFLEKLKQEIADLSKQTDHTKKLKDINLVINQNLHIEKDRQELQMHIDSQHQSFFHKLNEQLPGLTKNEERLCSLLVLGLASKDIATILNISPDGVKKSRYRLRKKLNLQTDDNLTEFLKSI